MVFSSCRSVRRLPLSPLPLSPCSFLFPSPSLSQRSVVCTLLSHVLAFLLRFPSSFLSACFSFVWGEQHSQAMATKGEASKPAHKAPAIRYAVFCVPCVAAAHPLLCPVSSPRARSSATSAATARRTPTPACCALRASPAAPTLPFVPRLSPPKK